MKSGLESFQDNRENNPMIICQPLKLSSFEYQKIWYLSFIFPGVSISFCLRSSFILITKKNLHNVSVPVRCQRGGIPTLWKLSQLRVIQDTTLHVQTGDQKEKEKVNTVKSLGFLTQPLSPNVISQMCFLESSESLPFTLTLHTIAD